MNVRNAKMKYTEKGRIKRKQHIDGKEYRFWGRAGNYHGALGKKSEEKKFVSDFNKPFGDFIIVKETKKSKEPFIILAKFNWNYADPNYEMHTPKTERSRIKKSLKKG